MSRTETQFTNYYSHCEGVADDFVDHYYESLLTENLMEGLVPDYYSWLEDGGELHQWIDQHIDLNEAVDILDQCINEETDSGLWEGLESPEDAIGAKAFWSYKGDLSFNFIPKELAKRLGQHIENTSIIIDTLQDEHSEMDEESEAYEELDERISELMTFVDNMEEFVSKELRSYL